MTNFSKIILPLLLIGCILSLTGCNTGNHSIATEAKAINPNTIPDIPSTDIPAVYFRNGQLEFYFSTQKSDVAGNALEKSKEILEAGKKGKHLGIRSYYNPILDLPRNPTLSKKRASAVRDFLLKQGIQDWQISLIKPIQTKLSEESLFRRFDVYVLPDGK